MTYLQLDLMCLRARKLLALATDFFYLRAFLRGGVAPAIEHRAVLQGLPLDFVVDVGANRGQFSLMCRRLKPLARIVAFEPLAEPAQIYQAVFEDDAGVRLHRCALGTKRGEMAMHVSARDDASSLLAISKVQTDNFPGTGAVELRMVPIAPMPDFIPPSDMGLRNLLKIDVQGFELEVLKSAGPLLPWFRWVYVECSYVPLYEGQALADQVAAYLQEQGFRLSGRFNASYSRLDGAVLQADLLFESATGA